MDDPVTAEAEIRAAAERNDAAAATRLALELYGPELFRFLLAWHRDETAASDVFALVGEAIWKKIVAYTWERPLRAWAFAVARRASLHHRRDVGRRRRLESPAATSILEVADQVRTATLSYLRTERRSRLDELRASLSEEDRALLFLRLDRKLAWNDLAIALGSKDGEDIDAEQLKKESARLRKRFQLVKDRLRERAVAEGLLADRDER